MGEGFAPGPVPQAILDKPFLFYRARLPPGQKGAISHSCQRCPRPWKRKRGLPKLPAPAAAPAGPTRGYVRAGVSPRGRVMCVKGRMAFKARPAL